MNYTKAWATMNAVSENFNTISGVTQLLKTVVTHSDTLEEETKDALIKSALTLLDLFEEKHDELFYDAWASTVTPIKKMEEQDKMADEILDAIDRAFDDNQKVRTGAKGQWLRIDNEDEGK